VTTGTVPRRALALSLGDPAGVGPEITVKAWRALKTVGPDFMVVGDFDALVAAAGTDRSTSVVRVGGPEEVRATFSNALPVLDIPLKSAVVAGKPSASYAPAVIRWIETGAGLALSGACSGLVTAPIAKAPLYDAGFKFPGHTEFLADLTAGAPFDGARGPVMMLTAKDLRVVLVTIHLSLATALTQITHDRIVETGLVTAQALKRDFAIPRPRLALAALNPHAGEGGALGREEIEVINPAAAALRSLGVSCGDARPADSLFHDDARGGYDAVICLYHDQALIPVKTIDFWGGVNITLGLPLVRTSPDHGVGFDIAGRGLARPESLIAAVRAAGEIAARREAARPFSG
jgi:4-hydroxythreonine-4-phosphate dehydrogenase